MILRTSEIRDFSARIVASGRVRIPLSDLWRMWDLSAPRLSGDHRQVAGLRDALTVLSDAGTIELPTGAWDLSTSPPLPRSVAVPESRPGARRRPWTTYPWCRQLGWVASLPTVTEARYEDLVRINDWLVRTNGVVVPEVPMRYRSAELFGDEKQLESMLRTNLFGDGRLSLAMLSCVRLPPPLAAAHVGEGPDVLVVENSDPYWAAVDALRADPGHSVGLVAWGCGRSFPTHVPTLSVDVADRGPVRGTVWYWGDMDPDGVSIAAEASRLSRVISGPPILPAHQLWDAMADHPGQNVGEVDWSNSAGGLEWLGVELAERLEKIRSEKARVAQESIAGRTITEWAHAVART